MLQTSCVLGLPAYFEVGQEAENRPTPIGPPPGARPIQYDLLFAASPEACPAQDQPTFLPALIVPRVLGAMPRPRNGVMWMEMGEIGKTP